MERIDHKIRTVYGKDLHDSHMSVTVRLDTDELEHGDTIRLVTHRVSTDEQDATNADSDNDGDEQETTADN